MSLTNGSKLGSYEILSPLGAGGMGEVYRARDTKLAREVAIKVLPEDVAGDATRLARFRREAQMLASLNHPNIAAIYGLEESDGVAALVLELVEGEDLAERLQRGAIPYEEAMAMARELAMGLEAAHEKGIVHRDLKPANVKLGADGGVKILDFGLAKAYEAEAASGGDSALSQSPTISRQMTEAGVILGTAAYMAPEQAKGRAVDKRADIWAFGVVLYEMLTGRRLFDGEDLTETLASVIKDEPDLSAVPPMVRRLLSKCLERDPKRRLRDIGDAWELLGDASSVSAPPSRVPWLIAAVATLVAIASLSLWISSSRPFDDSVAPVRFHIERPQSVRAGALDRSTFHLSPDGRHIVLVEGGQLWIRSLGSFAARGLEGTRGGSYPFWSPDSASIGFFADDELKKVSFDGTLVQTLCDAPGGRGGTWNHDGTILFSGHVGSSGISRVPSQGGTPEAVTMTGPTSGAHRYPEFLPDGEHFLYLLLGADPDTAGVYVGSLRGEPAVRVLAGSQIATYAPPASTGQPGHLLFRQEGTLMAQPFDLNRLANAGAMFPIASDVGSAGNSGYAAFSVARNGTLAYSAGERIRNELVWRDRSGQRSEAFHPTGMALDFSLAPDEKTVAMSIPGSDGFDVWLHDVANGTQSRFTFGPSPGWVMPQWSPEGDRLAFATGDNAGLGHYEIRVASVDMSSPARTVARSETVIGVWDWSPNGTHLLYSKFDDMGIDIWNLPLGDNQTASERIGGPGINLYPQYSPDSRWLAYESNEHGEPQVYVQPSIATGAVWQISTDGGGMPRWRGDSRELYYRAPDSTLMAVALRPSERDGGATGMLEHGTPQPLFDSVLSSELGRFTYEAASDGQRFLVSAPVAGAKGPISIVLNWQASIAH